MNKFWCIFRIFFKNTLGELYAIMIGVPLVIIVFLLISHWISNYGIYIKSFLYNILYQICLFLYLYKDFIIYFLFSIFNLFYIYGFYSALKYQWNKAKKEYSGIL